MSTSKTQVSLRVSPARAGELKRLSKTLGCTQNELLERIINDVLEREGTQRVLTMSVEDYVMHQVDNMRAGKPRHTGVEVFTSSK